MHTAITLNWQDANVRQQICGLRSLVFSLPTSDDEPLDASGLHFGVLEDAALVAAARLDVFRDCEEIPYLDRIDHLGITDLPTPIGVMSRLVVHPSSRRQGLGSLMDKHRIEVAKRRQLACLIGVTVAEYREAALAKLSFQKLGNCLPILHGPHANADLCPALMLLVLKETVLADTGSYPREAP